MGVAALHATLFLFECEPSGVAGHERHCTDHAASEFPVSAPTLLSSTRSDRWAITLPVTLASLTNAMAELRRSTGKRSTLARPSRREWRSLLVAMRRRRRTHPPPSSLRSTRRLKSRSSVWLRRRSPTAHVVSSWFVPFGFPCCQVESLASVLVLRCCSRATTARILL